MVNHKVLAYPGYQMVFEAALDDLMEEVRCEQLMYISTRKVVREWLYILKLSSETVILVPYSQ